MNKFNFKKLLKMVLFLPLLPIIGVGGVDGGDSTETGDTKGGEGDKKDTETKGDTTDTKVPDKTHSQADVDKVVQERVSREQKKYQKMIDDMKKTMGGDTGADTKGAEEGAEGVDPVANAAVQKATKAMEVANTRLIQATALSEAIKLGVDPKYTSDVVRLADMSKVVVNEDGTMDTAAISKSIDEVIKRVPVFKTTADSAGGFKVGGEGQKANTSNSGWGNGKKTETNSSPSKRWNNQNR